MVKVSAATGDESELIDEHDPFWLEPVDMMHFFADGSFVWAARGSGYMHLELHNPSGGRMRDLTPGDWDVTELAGVD